MDPNACYDLIADAISDRQWNDAAEHAGNLLRWLDMGGFKPTRAQISLAPLPHTMRGSLLTARLQQLNSYLTA